MPWPFHLPFLCLRPCQLLIVYTWIHFRLSLTFIAIAISSVHFCLCPCQFLIVYTRFPFRFSPTFIAIAISSPCFVFARVNSGLFILDYIFDYLWRLLPWPFHLPFFCLRPCQLLIVYIWLHFRLSLTFIAIAISSPPFLSSSVSTLDCLYLITLSIVSNVYCHSHFIRPFCVCPCQLLIVYTWFPFRFSLTFIAIAISSPLCCLRSCQLWIVYTWLHFRLSLTFIAIAISSPFLSLSVSTLDCLFLIALSIFSNVYCHSHFIPPFLSSLVSTLDCLYLNTLSIVFNVYCHSHFIPLFCLCPCQLWIVYSWLPFGLTLTFIAIAISSPLFVFFRVNSWLFILEYTFDFL